MSQEQQQENKQKIRIGLIFGGRSGEHEVSLASANLALPRFSEVFEHGSDASRTREMRSLRQKDRLSSLTGIEVAECLRDMRRSPPNKLTYLSQ